MKNRLLVTSVITLVLFGMPVFALALAVIEGPIVNPSNGHTYYLLETSTWTEAEAMSVSLGGHLVTINDQSENDWVYGNFHYAAPSGYSGLWIGLNDAAEEGSFEWVSGEPVEYTKWAPGQPDNTGEEDYTVMWNYTGQEGLWNDTLDDNWYFMHGYLTYGIVEVVYEKIPSSLEIVGPEAVAESSSAKYHAIAHYEDDTTRDVTAAATWSLEPDSLASISSSGLLTTEDIDQFETVIISADYTEIGISVYADKNVDIFAICPTGFALKYDGRNDYVSSGAIPELYVDDNFTWAFWLWLESGNYRDCEILGNRISFTGNSQFIKFSPTRFEYYPGFHDGTMSYSIPTETWIHLAVVKEGPNLTYYSNGNIVGNGIVTTNMPSIPLYFGGESRAPYGQNDFADCKIDEVQIWDVALPQEKIMSGMHRRLEGTEAGLAGYWNFDEGESQVASDLSGNGNDGRLGSDPCGPDDSDPVWVESDAPVGICSPQILIKQSISKAVRIKQGVLEDLEEAIAEEKKAQDMLRDMQQSRDTGEWSFRQVVKARVRVLWAIIKEMWAKRKLEQSKDSLEDSLDILNSDDAQPPSPNNGRRRRPGWQRRGR